MDIQKLQNSMSSIEQELTTTKQQRQNLENKSHSVKLHFIALVLPLY